MKIEVRNGIGIKNIDATGQSLKGVSIKGLINRLEIRCNGNIVYSFVNSENLTEFSDNNVDVPLRGSIEIKLFASDGEYDVMLFLQPHTALKSKAVYEDLKARK